MRDLPKADAVILHQALLNEVCLDRRYVQVFQPQGRFVPYKVMRQIALERRFGLLLKPALIVAAWLMPFVILVCWLGALGRSIGQAAPGKRPVAWIVPTIDTNVALIRDGLAEVGVNESLRVLSNLATQLPQLLGFRNVLAIYPATIHLLWRLLMTPGASRVALLLHSRDAVEFLLLARFASQHPNDVFATECHYQRWSFVLSHRANRLILVQHGLLDGQINFPCRGGDIEAAVLREESSVLVFRQYYRMIKQAVVHRPKVSLHPTPCSAPAVFLASSFPTIDQEIEFAQALRRYESLPLIVKLHPAHLYDKRGTELTNLADHQAKGNENPECAVFISHSSSMELLYRAHGIRTVSLAKQPSTLAAVESTLQAVAEYYQSINKTSTVD